MRLARTIAPKSNAWTPDQELAVLDQREHRALAYYNEGRDWEQRTGVVLPHYGGSLPVVFSALLRELESYAISVLLPRLQGTRHEERLRECIQRYVKASAELPNMPSPTDWKPIWFTFYVSTLTQLDARYATSIFGAHRTGPVHAWSDTLRECLENATDRRELAVPLEWGGARRILETAVGAERAIACTYYGLQTLSLIQRAPEQIHNLYTDKALKWPTKTTTSRNTS